MAETSRIEDKRGFPVDDGIKATVTILRLLGFRTTSSCEGHVDRVLTEPYVRFEAPGARRFCEQGMREKAARAALLEAQKLWAHLDDFYSQHPISFNRHLTVQFLPPLYTHLRCLGSERTAMVDNQDRTSIIEKSQMEMKTFTEYLKSHYFFREKESVLLP